MILAGIIILGVAIIALAYSVATAHNRIAALQKGRNVPMPKMINGAQCARCSQPVDSDAVEVNMTVQLFDDKEIPITFKLCKEHSY